MALGGRIGKLGRGLGRGSRRAVAQQATQDFAGRVVGQGFDELDKSRHGLAPLEQEIWRGFVFVRTMPGLPSVAEMMAPYEAEIAPHGFEDLMPQGRVTLRPRAVNWKNVADNYGDGLHIPVAHPGLTRLFAGSYRLEAKAWIDKMEGHITERPSPNWVERTYQSLLPVFEHLPKERRRLWSYYRLWPNLAFDVYPDQVDFMQFVPVSPTETLIREIAYARPDSRRDVRAARVLNWRINRRVNAEDTTLIARVQAGMSSSSYESGPLSKSEVCLAAFARRLRAASRWWTRSTARRRSCSIAKASSPSPRPRWE